MENSKQGCDLTSHPFAIFLDIANVWHDMHLLRRYRYNTNAPCHRRHHGHRLYPRNPSTRVHHTSLRVPPHRSRSPNRSHHHHLSRHPSLDLNPLVGVVAAAVVAAMAEQLYALNVSPLHPYCRYNTHAPQHTSHHDPPHPHRNSSTRAPDTSGSSQQTCAYVPYTSNSPMSAHTHRH